MIGISFGEYKIKYLQENKFFSFGGSILSDRTFYSYYK